MRGRKRFFCSGVPKGMITGATITRPKGMSAARRRAALLLEDVRCTASSRAAELLRPGRRHPALLGEDLLPAQQVVAAELARSWRPCRAGPAAGSAAASRAPRRGRRVLPGSSSGPWISPSSVLREYPYFALGSAACRPITFFGGKRRNVPRCFGCRAGTLPRRRACASCNCASSFGSR